MALAAAAGVGLLEIKVMPILDSRVSVRPFWRENRRQNVLLEPASELDFAPHPNTRSIIMPGAPCLNAAQDPSRSGIAWSQAQRHLRSKNLRFRDALNEIREYDIVDREGDHMAIADVVTDRQLAEQQYDAIVREDIELFRNQSNQFLSGQLTDDQFRAFRLRRGIYGQRQQGVQMIRTKIPGGLLTAEQMRTMARVADEFGGGKGHLTTRQNIQYHFVPLKQVPDLLHMLADVRLTTREACYNTVRNVTACPLSGLHPEEVFEVQPYARRLAFAFLHRELTDNLPRKLKVAFCGCPNDCMATAINDVGLRPLIRDGERGFRMTVAGGLGPLPTEAKVLHEFIPAEDVVRHVEAVIRVFNVHGNRKDKNTARLKFIMRKRGFDWLRDAIEEQYQDIVANGGIPRPETVPPSFGGFQPQPPPLGSGQMLPMFNPSAEFSGMARNQCGSSKARRLFHSHGSRFQQGNLTGDQMRGLASLCEQAGDGSLRVTMNQNVILAWVSCRRADRASLAC